MIFGGKLANKAVFFTERWTNFIKVFRKPQVRWAYIFLAPTMIILFIFLIVPIGISLFLSFTKYDIVSIKWISLQNYKELFNDAIFLKSFGNTIFFAAGTVIPATAISLILALLVNKKIRGITFFRAVYYLPVLMSWVAVSLIWLWIYQPRLGLLNYYLQKIGVPGRGWLDNPETALPSIMVMCLWQGVGWDMLIFLAALQGLPETVYEAAKIDGASNWHSFWHITLPLLKPVILFVLVGFSIWAFQMFAPMYVMTKGGPFYSTSTIVYRIYVQGFTYLKMGYASAMSFILFGMILALCFIIMKLLKSDIKF